MLARAGATALGGGATGSGAKSTATFCGIDSQPPESAASVRGATKRVAEGVMSTWTSAPSARRRRTRSTAFISTASTLSTGNADTPTITSRPRTA